MQKYKGIQLEYALCLRQVQIIFYHKQTNPNKYSVRNVQDMGNILTHMYQHGIFSRDDFNDRIIWVTNMLRLKWNGWKTDCFCSENCI